MNDESKKYWPAWDINLNLLAGAMEAGKDLYLTGSFGGFGGAFHQVHRDLEAAREAAKKHNEAGKSHVSVFKLRVTLEDEMVPIQVLKSVESIAKVYPHSGLKKVVLSPDLHKMLCDEFNHENVTGIIVHAGIEGKGKALKVEVLDTKERDVLWVE